MDKPCDYLRKIEKPFDLKVGIELDDKAVITGTLPWVADIMVCQADREDCVCPKSRSPRKITPHCWRVG